MAYSFIYHVGDGVTTNFSVPFTFLSRSHVYLKINGVASSAFSWANDGVIHTNSAPADGASILIYRDTPKDTRLVDFADNASLSAANLDLSADQIFFINQEEFDWARRGMDFIDDAQAAAIAAGLAKDGAEAARDIAVAAKNNALSYQTLASNAANTADAAQVTAVAAKDGAVVAKEQAVTAKDTALTYRDSAQAAKDATLVVKDAAIVAKNAAVTAKDAAEGYASDAALRASQALTSKTKAEQWANEAEDVEVESGLFSAKHWAAKAQDYVSEGSVDWTNVENKPTTFPPATHNHDTLYAALAHNHTGVYAPATHPHAISDVTNLQTTLDGKAASSHNHDTLYSVLAHNHTGVYSPIDHTHSNYLTSLSGDSNPSLSGALDCNNKPVYWDIYTISGTSIDVANGNKQKLTLSNTNITVSLSTPAGACAFHLYVYQGATPRTITWPTMLWLSGTPPDLNVASGKFVVCLTWDGANWFGSWARYY